MGGLGVWHCFFTVVYDSPVHIHTRITAHEVCRVQWVRVNGLDCIKVPAYPFSGSVGPFHKLKAESTITVCVLVW